MLRKIVFGIIFILALFIGLLFLIPQFFKGKIVDYAKTQLNEQLNAEVDFSDVSLSLLRDFPNLRATIQDLTVVGKGRFEKDTLANIGGLGVTVDFWTLFNPENPTVKGIYVNEPHIHAIVSKDGKANWDIAKASEEVDKSAESSGGDYKLSLQHYEVNDGRIFYEDLSSGTDLRIYGLDHEGNGDFSSAIFDLDTETSAESISLKYAGMKYLNKIRLTADAAIEVDNNQSKYTFKDNRVNLNNLKLAFDGTVSMLETATRADVKFSAAESDFKDLVSILPSAYTKDYDDVKAEGKMACSGFVKGVYSDSSYPAFNIDVDVKDGKIKYPDLPGVVDQINTKLTVENRDGILDHTEVRLLPLHFALEGEPFDLNILLKNPISDPFVDMSAIGKIDLAKLSKSYPVEGISQLAGLVDADIVAKGRVSAAQSGAYEDFDMSGNLTVKDLVAAGESLGKPMNVKDLSMDFSPQFAAVNRCLGAIGKTDFDVKGKVENLLPYYLGKGPLRGRVNMNSNQVDLNEWMIEDPDAAATTSAEGEAEAYQVIPVPADLDMVIGMDAGVVNYEDLQLNNVQGVLRVKDEQVVLERLQTNIFEGMVIMDGSYSTKESLKSPVVDMSYVLEEINIQKAFDKLNTMQALAPVGKFLDGNFSSRLKLKGKLDEHLMPDWMTWDGNGLMAVLSASLKNFEPLSKLANELQIAGLNSMNLKDVNTKFSFNQGRVSVAPFSISQQGVDMNISGSHGVDQTLEYSVLAAVPASKMGKQAKSMVDNLSAQAASQGIKLKLPEKINVKIDIGGTVQKPTLAVDYKDAFNDVKGGLKDMAKDLADSLKNAALDKAKAEADKVKAEAEAKAKAELDKAKSKADKARKEAEAKARKEMEAKKKQAEKEAKKVVEKQVDPVKEKAKGEVDKAKDKAKDALKGILGKP